ncbi:uncharacterized protein LOC112521286 isoform X1 [Cynara cardunculus var. scolymus]|uniref:Uncharacterized protein n=1 Tax=Cynara cardunculus var. scolymus TaxID=59895 RepID=A0A118JTN2_CYNCS|nr:uncharacterized protein LOC112521286 isoform X1 [Cynara cardunculus var. scolymus]XP_024985821.1 uncharacterized protein LOC112521286 isoform X1 [Cynara cardunculus var. scolymus]KVH90581.1 hypothetical protein Ccrd_007458 [Cynara cardunculus var. scolymus]
MQMDICSRIGFSPDDINRLHGIHLDTLGSTYGVMGDFSVDELAYGATKFLNIQDDDGVLGSIPPHKKGVFQMKNECGEAHQSEMITEDHKKLLSKCAIFPCSSKTLSSVAASVGGARKGKMKNDTDYTTSGVSTHDTAKSINPPCSSAISLPKPLKLVSAMKGSHEKGGVGPPLKKLSVKWAPDVYDPVPTSVVSNRGSSRKHNGKKKSKKKGSRESKGKEKKQSRKRGGRNSLNCYSEQKEEVIFVSAVDFHLDLDLFCGSSFPNPYGSSLHLSSIAEAT